MKSFYEFKGNWLYIFDQLVGIMTPSNVNRFTIWQSKSLNEEHLLIVYEIKLGREWENKAGLNRISESEFIMKYRSKIDNHVIHGTNEFGKARKHHFHPVLKRLASLF